MKLSNTLFAFTVDLCNIDKKQVDTHTHVYIDLARARGLFVNYVSSFIRGIKSVRPLRAHKRHVKITVRKRNFGFIKRTRLRALVRENDVQLTARTAAINVARNHVTRLYCCNEKKY